ncbi:MAG TPA: hypothetical protein VFR18_14820 [Terriglobia bacterium]|nr:hypothetical protein [Terriglobia bacterium]
MLRLSLLLLVLLQTLPTPQLRIEAPPNLAADKLRMESMDPSRLGHVVRLVGLEDPGAPIHIQLLSEPSGDAPAVAPWVAGFARQDNVVIFPSRSPRYPDSTLDDVLRHEVAHALIWRASSGRPIPRWFNEGLAMAAERPRLLDQTQLFAYLASGARLTLRDLDQLFEGGEADQARAYQLSRVLVWDLLREHGEHTGGRILRQISEGASFETAFTNVIGKSTDAVEADFFKRDSVWATWMPILFSQETLWLVITLLAILAIWRKRKRGAEIRKRWEEEEEEESE